MKDIDVINTLEKENDILIINTNDEDFDEYFDNSSQDYYTVNDRGEIVTLIINNADVFNFSSISSLLNLERLSINSAELLDFEKIESFKKLISLNLRECYIKDFYPISRLKKLAYLDLSSTNISDLSILENLNALKSLELRNNKINNILPLQNLNKLEVLFLWNNQISEINILVNLKKLKNLDIGRNNIECISSLSVLNDLRLIDISHNKINDIRPLEKFITKGYEIILDGDYEEHLENFIFLENNDFTIPPYEVITQGNATIIQYFEDARKYNLKSLNECKLIFVGDGGLGKTSLMKKIIGLPYSDEPTTHGINKKSWNEIKNNFDENIKVNLWDFGGQHIQHSLHQFFLTEKVVYILLLDPRNDSSAIYWLEQIEKLGKDSEILIVYNWKELKDKKSHNNKNFYELRKTYPTLREPFLLSCKNGDGFNEFKESLSQIILSRKDLLVQYPINWFKIKDELEKDVTISKNYIAYNEYDLICDNNEYYNEINRKNLLKQLDKIGSIVFFDKPILEELQVLNPDWITTGAYSVITSEITRIKKGHLNSNDLKEIFKDEKYLFANKKVKLKYKAKDFQFILALMSDYDLCVYNPFLKDEFLIPCAFEGEKPSEFERYKLDSKHYRFQFESAFEMLIMYRFMARNISKCIQDGYWQSGIVLQDLNKETYALVETNQHSKIIDFWITGKNIRGFWEVLRNDIKDINRKYSLKFKEEVKYDYDDNEDFFYNDYREIFLSYDEMISSLYHGIDVIEYHPTHRIKNINVLEVIENFEDSKKTIKKMEKEGIHFHGNVINNGQLLGNNNTQTIYNNYFSNNQKLEELKDILEDFEDASKTNKEWQDNFTNALLEICRLENAKNEIEEKKSISKLKKFFNKAKEIKDWVAIGVLPAELATKGSKMIELGNDLFQFIEKLPF
ncbi:COR domain-containing protein [Flavobacterium sp. MMS24-S5]|uniref:COR domain-containing protein n=1 Tax=Flavobacterium sp. MMS24-S5 TaxID=3416605 RepID=UPI003D036174